MSAAMRHPLRVIFGDTDQMGVVYYANYLRYFESARADYWRSLGRSYKDLEAWGVAMPVVEATCQYKRTAHYEDLLEIETWIGEVRGASVRFQYRVYRVASANTAVAPILLAEGFTRHAIIGPDGRPKPIPAAMRAVIPPVPAPTT